MIKIRVTLSEGQSQYNYPVMPCVIAAVTVSKFIVLASLVSEIWRATHTHARTHALTHILNSVIHMHTHTLTRVKNVSRGQSCAAKFG